MRNRLLAGTALAAVLALASAVHAAAVAASVSDLTACGAALGQKKFEEGVAFCTRALNAPRINASDQAYIYQRRARLFAAQRKFDEAIADFSEVIRLKPGFAENYADRANAYGNKARATRRSRTRMKLSAWTPQIFACACFAAPRGPISESLIWRLPISRP